ncbi:hypothetical protein LINGRAHAP2_LOCUS34023 [Linum grandiflorum]
MSSSSSSFSSSAITIFLVITTVVLALTVDYSSAVDQLPIQCGTSVPVDSGACQGNYGQCVTHLLTALRLVTPNNRNRVYYSSYPLNAARGGATGAANCVNGYSIQDCEDCLGNAQDWLDTYCNGYDSGHYVTSVCTMYYNQIPI